MLYEPSLQRLTALVTASDLMISWLDLARLNGCILPGATGCQVPKGLKRKHLVFPSLAFGFF